MEVKFCWYFWDRFGFSVFGILDGKLSVVFFTSSITITFSSVKSDDFMALLAIDISRYLSLAVEVAIEIPVLNHHVILASETFRR